MFSRRKDGRYIRTLDPYDKALSYVMSSRADAQVFFEDEIDCEVLDAYLQEKKEQGLSLSYLNLFTAACVRLYALRPALNRFVMNGRVFSRNQLSLSIAIKKRMRDDETSTVVKLYFTGRENIFEISERINAEIYKSKEKDDVNATDKLASTVMNLPGMIIKPAIYLLKLLDRWNILPMAVIQASPFHTSFWITYMKSLGIPPIYHHLYNFGTSSLFIGLGKEKKSAVVDQRTDEISVKKMIELKIVADERICDGMYNARSMRLLKKIMQDPRQLEEELAELPKDID